ncbi:MAG: LamG domain-containing protein, partial [OM182 bacterium]|nr:LamG domain-containing protein [OM182 bacterium]
MSLASSLVARLSTNSPKCSIASRIGWRSCIGVFFSLLLLFPYQTALAANVLAFDGSNDAVRKTSFSSGTFAQSRFSVELWFKSDAVNRGYLVQSANSSSAFDGEKIQYSMRLEAGGSVVASYGGKGSYVSAASSSSYGDGNWHHAAMTLASSGAFTLYIDGIAVATDSYTAAVGTKYYTLSTYLGVLTSTRFSNNSYFKGQMRDVRFWSDTRSAAEVLANKDATLTGAEAGLFTWYTLDQGVGGGTSTSTTTVIDSAGSNDAEPLNFSMGGTLSNFVPFVDNTIPTVSGLPATVTFTEDTKDEIDLSSALFDDADGDDLTVTITASAGVFDTPADGAAGGVTETLVSSTVVTLAGSPAAINSYLDTAANLQYTPA